MAKMALQLKERITDMQDLFSVITPKYYEVFVTVVQQMSLQKDQLGLTLSIYVKQLALKKVAECIVRGNAKEKAAAEDFLALYNSSWTQRVACAIGKRKTLKKLNKPTELPIESDLLKVSWRLLPGKLFFVL